MLKEINSNLEVNKLISELNTNKKYLCMIKIYSRFFNKIKVLYLSFWQIRQLPIYVLDWLFSFPKFFFIIAREKCFQLTHEFSEYKKLVQSNCKVNCVKLVLEYKYY